MSNLLLLLNTNLINEYKINNIKNANKKEKSKILATSTLIIVCICIFAYSIFKMCFSVSDILIQINQLELMLVIGFIVSSMFTIFTSLYKVQSYLFNSKDFDTLTSLPIKDSTILASKIIMLLFTNYLYSLGFTLIPCIVYFIKSDVSSIYFIYLIILILVLPLIPIVVSCIISFFIVSISSKFKYKNAILIIGSIVLLVGYMIVANKIQEIGIEILKNSKSIIDEITTIYPPTYYFVDALSNNNFISLIVFMLISLIPFIIFIKIFSKQYKNINVKMNEGYKNKTYIIKELKQTKLINALIKKELNRYFSSYIYVLNTSIGMILLLVMTIGITIFRAEKINMIFELNLDMNMLKPQLIIIILFMIITTCTTYCSISLEGKSLWILKSLPIKEIDIFKSKIYMNLLLNMPISIICFLVLSIKLKFDISFIIIMTLTIISICLLVSLGGLLCNLYFPNTNWKNEVAVVKKSIGIIVILFGGIIYLGIYTWTYFKLQISNINSYLLLATIITFILDILIYQIIKTKGIKLFRNIN